MQLLLDFLYRFRIFGLFLFLELICFWLYFRYNRYYNAYFFNSSNQIAGSVQSFSTNSSEYLELRQVNKNLAVENAQLRQLLSNQNLKPATLRSVLKDTGQYNIVTARVVNNSVNRSSNFLTLNKGTTEGIKPEMGVVSSNGVVGKVKSVSRNYSTVISLLHQKMMVSSELKKSKTLCTIQWDALDPQEVELKYVPRHIELFIGDSIVTSGFNSIFPENILVGTVSDLDLPDESPFYEAKVRLATDFQSLEYVYVVRNRFRAEKDSLEAINE